MSLLLSEALSALQQYLVNEARGHAASTLWCHALRVQTRRALAYLTLDVAFPALETELVAALQRAKLVRWKVLVADRTGEHPTVSSRLSVERVILDILRAVNAAATRRRRRR